MNAQNDNGYCALHMVTSSESLVPEIIEILIENRARLDVVETDLKAAWTLEDCCAPTTRKKNT